MARRFAVCCKVGDAILGRAIANEASKGNQQKPSTPIGPQTKGATMSHLELAAILRAKAWRNYPGVFTAPETRQERTARVVVKVLDGPTGGDTLTKTTFVQRLNT